MFDLDVHISELKAGDRFVERGYATVFEAIEDVREVDEARKSGYEIKALGQGSCVPMTFFEAYQTGGHGLKLKRA